MNGSDSEGDAEATVIEQRFEHARRLARRRAISRRDWDAALAVTVKSRRLPTIARWWRRGRLDDGELGALLRAWWPTVEFPYRLGDLPLELFAAAGLVEDYPMPSGDPLVIYRGQGAGQEPGVSWTLHEDQAEWFARRFPVARKVVLQGMVARMAVLAYFNGRCEQEIVVDPHTVVSVAIREL